MKKRKFSFILILAICFLLFPFNSFAQAETISVRLSNYIGNTNSLNVETIGKYKLANGNIRMAGKDRFQVANNIASSGWNKAESVVIVNYTAFADALAAAPFAYYIDAPILLTQPASLTTDTANKIKQLSPKNIYIIGGEGSVSSNVANQLKQITSNVNRIGGSDRFEVAKNIAAQIPNNGQAVVTNGMVFADALSIAPYAARNGIPILLTTKDMLPESTKQALNGKTSSLIIGGTGSVSDGIASQLNGVTRIGGADRFEVSANIIRELNLPAETAFISTGLTFADALTGSVLAAKQNAPMLLTRPEQLSVPVTKVINDKGITSFTILGGTGSVSEALVASLPNEVRLAEKTTYTVKNENGRLRLYNGNSRIKDFGTQAFTLVPEQYSSQHQIKVNNRSYLGNMEFTIENGNVRPINRNIPFEDYLKGVVPREMPASWGLEALKAQAVAARTYSINDIGKTVADTQAYQVYGGYSWGTDQWEQRTNRAVAETAGQVLRFDGRVIGRNAVYSSSNGGYIESNANEWGTSQVAYLNAKEDRWDPKNLWKIEMKKTQIDTTGLNLQNPGHWWGTVREADVSVTNSLKNYLTKNGYENMDIKIVSINDFIIAHERTTGQRSINATIDVDIFVRNPATNEYRFDSNKDIERINIKRTLSVKEFRSIFGASNFRSTLLDLTIYDSTTDVLTIRGRGFGHGVGMSQTGANRMANGGFSYKEILSHYYPGTTVGK
ncbi:SpoIID/LytB domain-containing protein [Bacillus sp. B15-48]|uniref:SpoIID/LytB domain-containing protein n=1 Tax=Bacillus sp. B15-48 TaxID=1548601 RepID=UPI00193F1801|nr:SpoIID/LytB domain-containing protein [Bacillus sp. B15-48]MBM4760897.1 SpoIID/LytB domain-containing protein [Bacillus sp. B15-48]